MKIGFLLALCTLTITTARAEEFVPAAIADVAVMNGRDDGKYDVYCTNGNREVVTDLDLRLNNVCPNLKSSKPTGILSLQKRADGQFDVVCRDFKKIVATEAQVMEGNLCAPAAPKILLEEGIYKVISGYNNYYNQQIKPIIEGTVMTGVDLNVKETNWSCRFECKEALCQGKTNNSTCLASKIEVLGPKQYRYRSSYPEAIFAKQ